MIKHSLALLISALMMGLVGCASPPSVTYVPVTAEPVTVAAVLSTELAPTDTPVIARVNGQPISEAMVQRRVAQLQAGNNADGAQLHQQAINGLISQAVIDQSAHLEGITVSDAALQARLEALKQEQSVSGFETWLRRNNFTEAEFEDTLRREMITTALYEQVVQAVPFWAEQIHARQIVVADPAQIETIQARLAAGELFADLALELSEDAATRINGGDLGWFPPGVGVVAPEVEAAAFALPAGQISEMIKTETGYCLIKVDLKDPHRALTPEHRQLLQATWFETWLSQQRALARIEQ